MSNATLQTQELRARSAFSGPASKDSRSAALCSVDAMVNAGRVALPARSPSRQGGAFSDTTQNTLRIKDRAAVTGIRRGKGNQRTDKQHPAVGDTTPAGRRE
jgi:hypothetical protein